ncbi:OsmC family protein [Stieleria sp. JC731]|uniref:OsmC family protein n=1 Tax=Pirellulaceae TaxID=2691357 RepID=UPI001E330F5D|nr:OsmC family protein [Stieleria sp. JC731]MCC9602068.1 OsmC family protein [Stieleria sp. JC731]
MKTESSAHWEGGLKDGHGKLNTESGVLKETPYEFKTRFEDAVGTNPEELIGAAHAGCFSMALSNILGQSDMTADSIDTKASVTLEKGDDGPAITKVHLEVSAKIPGASEEAFLECANKAKTGCPVSRLLNAEITMDAKLVS